MSRLIGLGLVLWAGACATSVHAQNVRSADVRSGHSGEAYQCVSFSYMEEFEVLLRSAEASFLCRNNGDRSDLVGNVVQSGADVEADRLSVSGGMQMRAYVDPTTGKLVSRPIPGVHAAPASQKTELTTGAVQERMPDGSVILRKAGGFRVNLIATVDADGAVTLSHAPAPADETPDAESAERGAEE